jgi:hypothetical protein
VKVRLLLGFLAISIIALATSIAVIIQTAPPLPCTPVMVMAVGACDAEGTCGAVVVTQEGEVGKLQMSYPIAGYPECVP